MRARAKAKFDELKKNNALKDVFLITFVIAAVVIFFYIMEWDDSLFQFLGQINNRNVSIIILISILLSISLVMFSIRRYRELKLEIIERQSADKRMQRSRVQLQAVIDGVPDMILQLDTNAHIIWANKEALKRNPHAIGKTFDNAFEITEESFIDYYCKLAMESQQIEKVIKYQPAMMGVKGESYWEGIIVPLAGNDKKVYGSIAIARDVTERMRVEHTWNLLASMVESTDDAIFGMAFGGAILTWNQGAEKTYGYSAEEIVGKNVSLIVPVEKRDEIMRLIDRVIRKQTIEQLETTRIRKDGKQIFVAISICPFVDVSGQKLGVSSIERDITESKLAEEALKRSEGRFRQMAETIQDAFWLTDISHNKFLFVSPAFESIWGRPIDSLYTNNKVWFDSIYFEDLPIVKKAILELINNDGMDIDYRIVRPNGKIRWIHDRGFPVRDDSGKIIGRAGISTDITLNKQAEEALRTSEEKFRTLVKTAPDGIVLTDADGIIVEVNDAFTNIFQSTQEEMIGQHLTFLLPGQEEKATVTTLDEIITNPDSIPHYETDVTTKLGNQIPVEISNAVLKDDNMEIIGIIAILRDISVRKSFENELKNSREQLRYLAMHLQTAREDEKKRIAFEIHDELGYALTALKLELAWLAKKLNIKEDYIKNKIKEMFELIEMTIKKVRTISSQLRPSILDHFGLIAAIEQQADEFQKRTAIRCKLSIEPQELFFDDPKSTAIFRIFQETLTNIARHARATRVDVNLYQTDHEVVLKVIDNGVGIPPGQLDNHKSIGLIGIRERTEFLGGVVDISSENGNGTTVTLKIPIEIMETKK